MQPERQCQPRRNMPPLTATRASRGGAGVRGVRRQRPRMQAEGLSGTLQRNTPCST